MKKYILLLIGLSVLLFSCSNDKELILNEYKKVEELIKNRSYDSLMLKLDNKSVEFVQYLSDTSNLNYPTMKTFGEANNLKYFTTVYNQQWGSEIRKEENSLFTNQDYPFFVYLELNNLPLFGLFSENRLVEDQTVVGDENYVVLATEAADNVFITSKVSFTKDAQGEFKLDLLPLLKLRNRVLFQSYTQFYSSLGTMIEESSTRELKYRSSGIEVPKDKLLYYLSNIEAMEGKELLLRYNPRKKSH